MVDGPDGAGKSTLLPRLAARLRGRGFDVLEVREPGGTPLAEAARRVVLASEHDASPLAELFLYLAARADLVAKVIRPALAAGQVVLCDRYELATEAYQVAGRALPREPVLAANRLATGGLRPDLTLVLDVPADVGLARQAAVGKRADRIESEAPEWHRRVAAAFREASGPGIVHVDATQTPDDIEAAAVAAVEPVVRNLEGVGGSQIETRGGKR